MPVVKKDEYIEISVKDILSRLWGNKIIFLLVLIITLVVGWGFISKKNFNSFSYTANISLPININGTVLMLPWQVQTIYKSDKYEAKDKFLNIGTSSDSWSINLTYISEQPIEKNIMDSRVIDFINFLNNSDYLGRATISYVNILNQTNQHIELIEAKLKEYKSKKSSEIIDLGIAILENYLIAYNGQKLQANLDLKNAKFTVNETSVDYIKKSRKKYMIALLVFSLLLSTFIALGVDFLRERFLNRKS